MKTAARWLGGILLLLVLLVVVGGVILYTFDWNRAKPRVESMVADATGRSFSIDGDLAVDWQRDREADGLGRFIPLPVIRAHDVTLGNPDWAEHDDMARVKELSFGVELLPLLERAVVLRALSLVGAEVAIERGEDRNNWTFETGDEPDEEPNAEPWRLAVSEVLMSEGTLAYRDAPLELSLDARIRPEGGKVALEPGAQAAGAAVQTAPAAETTNGQASSAPAAPAPTPAPAQYAMQFDFTGTYREAAVEGSGKTGEMLSLRDPQVRFPFLLDLRAGKVEAQAEGRIGNLYEHPEVDLQLKLEAPSMAMLFPLTGVVLPNTPPFATDGHLVGSLDPENSVWRYENFRGSVGKSDLQGSVVYEGSGERPKLSGDMKSKLLRFADLGPLVGVGGQNSDPAAAEASARKGQKASNKRPGRVLPDNEFITERWNAMDLDLRFTGERIVQGESLPLDNVRIHAVLSDSVLKLTPLEFGVASGALKADITLDGKADPMNARLIANVRGVQLPDLFPTVEAMQQSAGRIDGAVALVSRGNSVSELLAESGGEVKVYLQSGRISRFLLEAASLNIASAVAAKLFGDSEVSIRCAGVSMALKGGLGTMRDFRISTDDALIDVTGAVDFADERLALDIKPESNDLKLISLRTPLYVDGTFADPEIGLEKGPLLLRAGAAAALVAIAPAAAALLPITVPGSDKEVDCGELLREARSKPTTRPDTTSPIDDKTKPEAEESNGERRDAGTDIAPKAVDLPDEPATRRTSDRDSQTFGAGRGSPQSTLEAR